MSTTVDEILTQAEPWLTPVTPERPGGERADDDERHYAVTSEIGKLESPAAWGGPNWRTILRSGGELLQDRSKDLLIANYMAYAMYHQDGVRGLTRGVALVTGLVERFWETMFPEVKRVRGRANAVAWLIAKAAEALSRYKPAPSDGPALGELVAILERLQSASRERFGNATPSFRPLFDEIDRRRVELEATSAREREADEIGAVLVRAAHEERRTSSASPLAYRLMRAGLYTFVVEAPETDASGRTRVTAPPSELFERMTSLTRDHLWPSLVEEAEVALTTHRFWLDLHRYVALGLAGLGETHASARTEVVREALQIARRTPALLTQQFGNGTPFADEKTRRWFLTEALA